MDRVRQHLEAAAGSAPASSVVLRVGLGVVIFLSGAHKLVDPGAWGQYLAPAFARRWPVSVEASMVAFGVSELPFGALLVVGRYTALAAAVVAVSMLGVLVDLSVLFVQTGSGLDVLVRDLGIAVLAAGVALDAATDGQSGDE